MSCNRLLVSTVVAGFVVLAASHAEAQAKRPDFSGSWQQDITASKALTEKHGEVWRVAGSTTGGATQTPRPDAKVMQPTTIITQSATELVIERRFEDEVIDRNVLKLDGSVSVNATKNSSTRSTTVWKGNTLVTTGTTHFDFSDANVTVGGKPATEMTRDFVTTRSLMADGTIQVENRSTQNGETRVSWTVLVRVKGS
jgi:hypothetical protein